jgi:hypothetical protein
MSFWDDFLSGGYDQASQGYQNGINGINDYYNKATGFMNPYQQFGQGELGAYGQGVNAMADPNKFINGIMSNYSMSPQAQFQQQQGQKGINAGAAASGMLGSSPEAQQLSQFNQQVTNNDQSNYLNQRLGVYDQFLNGAGNIANMGYGAAGQMGNWAMDAGGSLAQLYGQQGMANMYGAQSMLGDIGSAAGFAYGKGWL